MIKLVWFVLFLFYGYYKVGPKAEVAYLSSILSFLGVLYLNSIAVFGLLNIDIDYIMPFKMADEKWMRYLKIAVFMAIPGYLLMTSFFKEDRIKKLEYDKEKIQVGNFLLVMYIILSVLAVIVIGRIKN